jgi:hypothetical protein
MKRLFVIRTQELQGKEDENQVSNGLIQNNDEEISRCQQRRNYN